MKNFLLGAIALILLSACANSPTASPVSPTNPPAATVAPTPLALFDQGWDPFAIGYYDSSKVVGFAMDKDDHVLYAAAPAAYIQFIIPIWNGNSAVISFPLAPDQKGGLVDGVFDSKDALIFDGVDHSADTNIGGTSRGVIIVYGVDPRSRPEGFALVDSQGHQLSTDLIDPPFAYNLSLAAYSMTTNFFIQNSENMVEVKNGVFVLNTLLDNVSQSASYYPALTNDYSKMPTLEITPTP
jgi:hypothetical protein